MDPRLIVHGAAQAFVRFVVIAVLIAFGLGAFVAWLVSTSLR